MALESAFQDLRAQLDNLRDVLVGLRVTVVEDKPRLDDIVLVDVLSDHIDEMAGRVEEARLAAAEGLRSVDGRHDPGGARRAVIACQEHYNLMSNRFVSDLVRYERIAQLIRVGRERGGEWRAWSRGVRDALEGCRQPLFEVGQALFACWRELVERAGMSSSVTVRATNIGPRVVLPAASQAATPPVKRSARASRRKAPVAAQEAVRAGAP